MARAAAQWDHWLTLRRALCGTHGVVEHELTIEDEPWHADDV